MDGDAITIIMTIVASMVTQTSLIMYKIGKLEQAINELRRRLNRVEERVF